MGYFRVAVIVDAKDLENVFRSSSDNALPLPGVPGILNLMDLSCNVGARNRCLKSFKIVKEKYHVAYGGHRSGPAYHQQAFSKLKSSLSVLLT